MFCVIKDLVLCTCSSLSVGALVSATRHKRYICGVELYFSNYFHFVYIFVAFMSVAFLSATQIKFKVRIYFTPSIRKLLFQELSSGGGRHKKFLNPFLPRTNAFITKTPPSNSGYYPYSPSVFLYIAIPPLN